jgi:membrane fusion protein, multidrug efflux system
LKTSKTLIILGLLIIGIVIYINKCNKENSLPVSGKPGGGTQQPIIVNGVVITSQPITEKIYASGTLLANDEVEIRNEIPGRVTALPFREGSHVKKGELLLTLYDEDLKAQLRKLQLQKEIADKSVKRQEDLLTVNGISQQEFEVSQNELSSIQADIDLLKSQLSKTRILAPFDGIIGLRTVSAGAYIPINTRIATIQSINPLKMEFALPERYRAMIKDTTTIHFTTESSEGIFNGKIYAFEPKIDLQTRSVLVRAMCPNREFKLFPGAFAHIEIPLKKIDDAILIPTQALVPELKGQKVYVSRNGVAEKVSVETGMRSDSAVQITSGLQVGDTVLITGIMQVRPGSPLLMKVKSQTNK